MNNLIMGGAERLASEFCNFCHPVFLAQVGKNGSAIHKTGKDFKPGM